MKIGVLDSGIGGLTVLATLIKNCPKHEYIYYGDTIHLPYGSKTREEMLNYTNGIIKFLEGEEVDLIIIACGTISSNIEYIKSKKEIIDIVSPIKGKLDNYSKISVIATPLSVETNAFKKYINTEINLISCPLLVPIIENREYEKLDGVLKEYLKNTEDSDALILGCTHYSIIKNKISEYFKKDIIILGDFIVEKVAKLKESDFKLKLYFSLITKDLEKNVKNILSDVCNKQDIHIERREI